MNLAGEEAIRLIHPIPRGQQPYEQDYSPVYAGLGRDGKQDWQTMIARDNRATGIRTQKRDRWEARASLKSGDYDALPNGKRRRYSNRCGAYVL